jgi:hypothetical protein
MRTIVTLGAASCACALLIHGLQKSRDASAAALGPPSNDSAAWEAMNTTGAIYGDGVAVLGSSMPWALVLVFVLGSVALGALVMGAGR